ncbi:MAG: HesA/MoeB/ThiF family protein [Thermaurantiacus sp.]
MDLTDRQLERYARHIVLKEVGGAGQKRLLAARIAVVGAGGIGCPALAYLAAAGVGAVTLIDDDRVDLSNLQRQILFTETDIGAPKAKVAAARAAALNPDCHVMPVVARLEAGNAEALLHGHELVLDGTDSFASRAAVNQAAVRLGLPLVAAAIGSFEGHVGTFAGHLADAPCWACLAGAATDREGASCAEAGVLGALAGVLGALAALEAIRLLTGFGGETVGRLLLFDAMGFEARTVRLPKDPACPVCSTAAREAA